MGLFVRPRVAPIRRVGLPGHAPQASEAAKESRRSLPRRDFRTVTDCAPEAEFVKRLTLSIQQGCVKLGQGECKHQARADTSQRAQGPQYGPSWPAKSLRHRVPSFTPAAVHGPLERLMFTACVYCELMLPALSMTRTLTVCAPGPVTLTVAVDVDALLTGPPSTQ